MCRPLRMCLLVLRVCVPVCLRVSVSVSVSVCLRVSPCVHVSVPKGDPAKTQRNHIAVAVENVGRAVASEHAESHAPENSPAAAHVMPPETADGSECLCCRLASRSGTSSTRCGGSDEGDEDEGDEEQ